MKNTEVSVLKSFQYEPVLLLDSMTQNSTVCFQYENGWKDTEPGNARHPETIQSRKILCKLSLLHALHNYVRVGEIPRLYMYVCISIVVTHSSSRCPYLLFSSSLPLIIVLSSQYLTSSFSLSRCHIPEFFLPLQLADFIIMICFNCYNHYPL